MTREKGLFGNHYNSIDDLRKLKVPEIIRLLNSLGISSTGLLEKEELIARLAEVLDLSVIGTSYEDKVLISLNTVGQKEPLEKIKKSPIECSKQNAAILMSSTMKLDINRNKIVSLENSISEKEAQIASLQREVKDDNSRLNVLEARRSELIDIVYNAKINAYDGAVYLRVSFESKEQVKILGACWDPSCKSWYIGKDVDPIPFKRWIP